MFFYDKSRRTKEECFKECISNTLFTAIFNNFQGSEFVIIEIDAPEDICIFDDPTIDKYFNDEYQKSTAIKVEDLDILMIKNIYINNDAYNKHLRWWYFANNHENCCSQSIDKDLFKAVLIMVDTMNYKKKLEYLDESMYNLNKYNKINFKKYLVDDL